MGFEIDEENPLMNLVPADSAEAEALQEEKYVEPEAEEPEVELIDPEETPLESQELGQVPTTVVSRQLSPAIEQAAGTIKEGLKNVKSDVWVGMAIGAVVVLTARYVMHGEL